MTKLLQLRLVERSAIISLIALLLNDLKNKMASRFVNIEESAINALKTKAENDSSLNCEMLINCQKHVFCIHVTMN